MEIRGYVEEHRERFLSELVEYCRIPSVAAAGTGLEEARGFATEQLERLGATVTPLDVPGARGPAILGALGPASAPRTLLIYNHYDVQPPEPLDEWDSPPFEPTERGGALFGRGVADNKANFLSRAQAVEAWLATRGDLPVRILWLLEGEEEIGSPSLPDVCRQHGHLWSGADGCLWEAGYKDQAGRMVLYSGLKGLAAFELTARCASSDMHSSWATLVPNAAWRLVWALATLKDRDENILIDGLMDAVAPPTPAERRFVEQIPYDDEAFRVAHGVPEFVTGVTGSDALMRHLYQPTCTITGLSSGYSGPDMKTVLPSVAVAKVGFRLVPDLTPELVDEMLRRHLLETGFEDIEVTTLAGERPAPGQVESAVVRSALAAVEDVSGVAPVLWPHMAGTGPMYEVCAQYGIPAVGFGTGYFGSLVHAPNENVRLADYFEGIEVASEFIDRFASITGYRPM
ncbi:MAG: M20/M25/M40 family metallo-hydrolase [Anaerolineae bacterium]